MPTEPDEDKNRAAKCNDPTSTNVHIKKADFAVLKK
jgi:hypothetical protein